MMVLNIEKSPFGLLFICLVNTENMHKNPSVQSFQLLGNNYLAKKIQIYRRWFLWKAISCVDSGLGHFGAINKWTAEKNLSWNIYY